MVLQPLRNATVLLERIDRYITSKWVCVGKREIKKDMEHKKVNCAMQITNNQKASV